MMAVAVCRFSLPVLTGRFLQAVLQEENGVMVRYAFFMQSVNSRNGVC